LDMAFANGYPANVIKRKGGGAAGRGPSPIIDGEPISLPTPTTKRSESTYGLAGVGDVVAQMTRDACVRRICATKTRCFTMAAARLARLVPRRRI
jgi:hypothetical protein